MNLIYLLIQSIRPGRILKLHTNDIRIVNDLLYKDIDASRNLFSSYELYKFDEWDKDLVGYEEDDFLQLFTKSFLKIQNSLISVDSLKLLGIFGNISDEFDVEDYLTAYANLELRNIQLFELSQFVKNFSRGVNISYINKKPYTLLLQSILDGVKIYTDLCDKLRNINYYAQYRNRLVFTV